MESHNTRAKLSSEILHLRYGVDPSSIRVVFAPYRVCPLGAHIDHQLGSVTAMAIDQGVTLAYARAPGREVRLSSLNFPNDVRFDLDAIDPVQPGDWGNYIRGAAFALAQAGHTLNCGLIGLVSGRQWSEGGLSSSAAVGIAYLMALEDVNELEVTPWENIRLDQAIENTYLGLHNGILDQSAVVLSHKNELTIINCANATHELVVPMTEMPPWKIIIAFSGYQKALTGTAYNRRVAECAEAARILLQAAGRETEKPLLGNVRDSEYAEHQDKLPAPLARRAAHFFTEVQRVRHGVEAWKKGDLQKFGRLMTASGESSILNYECGTGPLIDLYHVLGQCEAVYGARFSGAGFRGCCIGLVVPEEAEQASKEIHHAYALCQPELAANASVVVCDSDDGARLLRP